MAAATVDSAAAGTKLGLEILRQYITYIFNNDSPRGIIFPIADVADVPATSVDDTDDIFRLSPKLPGGYIWDFAGTPSDMDSGANLAYSVVWITETGTVAKTFVSGSTKAQAASGTDRISDATAGVYVPEGYLALKITTGAGAGALAGTYHWRIQYSYGVLKPRKTIEGPYLLDVNA
jgi:hypothetical protein